LNGLYRREEYSAPGQSRRSATALFEVEQLLADDVLIADVRADLTPADMVDRKLNSLLRDPPSVVSRMQVGVPRIRG
jgi:hypothetical protein